MADSHNVLGWFGGRTGNLNLPGSPPAAGSVLFARTGVLWFLATARGVRQLISTSLALINGLVIALQIRPDCLFERSAADRASHGRRTVRIPLQGDLDLPRRVFRRLRELLQTNSRASASSVPGPAAQLPRAGIRLRHLASPEALSAWIGLVYLGFCLAMQKLSGCWTSGFVGYPDEPAHFVGAAMVRDWLMSGQWLTPVEFARSYQAHYPFFAVGYWPPVFSVAAGCWMLISGVGRLQALVFTAATAAATAWLIFTVLRSRTGLVIAFSAGLFFLCLPHGRKAMCAVMIDHLTTFLSVSVGLLTLRHVRKPSWAGAAALSLTCVAAILSKYSVAYLAVFPLSAVFLLRGLSAVRERKVSMQPLITVVLVAPWVLATWKMASYGLPSARSPLIEKAVGCLEVLFRPLPGLLTILVLVGAVGVIGKWRSWREETIVFGLLGAMHGGLVILSPVGPEGRYLLVAAAAITILTFAGWAELARMQVRWRGAVPAICLLAAAFSVARVTMDGRTVSGTNSAIREVVGALSTDAARGGQRILVPPNAEGRVIAEFVAQSRRRPDHVLLRPGKVLAESDWFGGNYSTPFTDSAQMLAFFQDHPVDLVIWNETVIRNPKPHARILGEMLRKYPSAWRKARAFGSEDDPGGAWFIYEFQNSQMHNPDPEISRTCQEIRNKENVFDSSQSAVKCGKPPQVQ